MGRIFKAHDNHLDKDVVLKLLLTSFANDSAYLRFQREAKLACKLNHPGIVGTYDFGVTKLNNPYIVMEFIEGRSLWEILKEFPRLPDKLAMKITYQIASAMAYSHNKGIIHRDLKTANIIISNYPDDPHVTLIDFGLATRGEEHETGKLTEAGTILGTIPYMAPEQARGKQGDERSDVYALGCILFQMLTGQVPILEKDAVSLVRKKVSEKAPSLSSINPEISYYEDFEAVVAKSLSIEPEQRQRSMLQFREELESTQNEITQATTAFKTPLFKKIKIRRVDIAAVLISLVLGGGIFAYLKHQVEQSDKKVKETEEIAKEIVTKKLKDEKILFKLNNDYLENRNTVRRLLIEAEHSVKDEDLAQIEQTVPQYFHYQDINNVRRIIPTSKNFYGLKLYNTEISGAGLKYISKIPFEYLDLTKTEIQAENFQYLNKMNRLKCLSLRDSSIADEGLKYVGKCPKIEALILTSCKKLDDNSMALIENLPLKQLHLSKTNITDNGMKYVGKIETLEQLLLDNTDITDDAFDDLKNCHKLLDLKIAGCKKVTKKGLENIVSYWPNLHDLDISNMGLKREDLKPLRKFRSIQNLCLLGIPLEDRDVDWIVEKKDLKRLMLQDTKITDGGFLRLTELNLVTISIKNCPNISKDAIRKGKAKWEANLRKLKLETGHKRVFDIVCDGDAGSVIGDDLAGLFEEQEKVDQKKDPLTDYYQESKN